MASGKADNLRAMREAAYNDLHITPIEARGTVVSPSLLVAHIAELEAEVARLKRALRNNVTSDEMPVTESNNVTDNVTLYPTVAEQEAVRAFLADERRRGRPKQHGSAAERQRAYRERRKGAK